MTAINRFTSLMAAAGAGIVAQDALAGPGCNQSGITSSGYSSGYQPALYQLTAGDRSAARAYYAGTGYRSVGCLRSLDSYAVGDGQADATRKRLCHRP